MMEFSKFWLIGNTAVSLFLILLCIFGVPIAQLALTTAAGGFYYWKAKNENRAKYAQKFMKQWAKEYGPETAARIAEIVLKD